MSAPAVTWEERATCWVGTRADGRIVCLVRKGSVDAAEALALASALIGAAEDAVREQLRREREGRAA